MVSVQRIGFTCRQAQAKNKATSIEGKRQTSPVYDCVSFKSANNFGEVVAGKLYRSAEPSLEGLQAMVKDLGIKVFFRAKGYSEESAKKAEQCGIKYIAHDAYGDADELIKSTKELQELVEKGVPVLVFCDRGESRTGRLIASYQHFVEKLSDEEIMTHALEHGGNEESFKSLLRLLKLYDFD